MSEDMRVTLADELCEASIKIENFTEDRQEIYVLLMRAIIELRSLTHRVAVLEDIMKENN